MSEIADTPVPASAPTRPVTGAGIQTVREAYSFACMRCGYGWEQSFDIEHHVDGKGQPFLIYTIDGERVPSPLSNPTCLNCGGHVVRIMREGQVSSVLGTLDRIYHDRRIAPGIAGPVPATHERRAEHHHEKRRSNRPAELHEAPGPVPVTSEDRGERRGLLARLKGLFRSS